MDYERAGYLASAAGRSAVASLDPTLASLAPHRLADVLRRDYPAWQASALAEQLALRARARERFGDLPFGVPGANLFSAAGLEMLTHPAVAHRRAARLAAAALPVVDLTAGLGGDVGAAAAAGLRCAALERDAATALLLAANVPRAWVVRGDATRAPFETTRAAVILDPARRDASRRTWDLANLAPPWGQVLAVASGACVAVVKLAPGLDHRDIPREAEAEFVQLGRSMREAALWFGQGAAAGLRRAVLLPAGAGAALELDSLAPQTAGEGGIGAFLHDPESCVTRAGLVRQLAHRLDARMLDPQVAYLSGETAALCPLAATFAVRDVVPFSVARLRAQLRARGWAPTEIRRRAFPVEPDELRRLLGPVDGEPVTLLCTTVASRRIVVVATRVRG